VSFTNSQKTNATESKNSGPLFLLSLVLFLVFKQHLMEQPLYR